MNKATFSIFLALILCSPAAGGLWYDSDTGDDVLWGSRIPIVLDESLGLERVDEPVFVSLKGLNFSSIRVVDPMGFPDEASEVGGNDIPYQTDGGELVFLGSVDSRGKKTYYLYLSEDPVGDKVYLGGDLRVSSGRYGLVVENSEASWEISDGGYYFGVSRYENRGYNGSVARSSGLDWGERIQSKSDRENFPAYGKYWNCSVLDSGPVRLRINCSTSSFSYALNRTYSFFSRNVFFEVDEFLDVLDEEKRDVRLDVKNRVAPFFNETWSYGSAEYVGNDSFYLAARDVNNGTGRFVFYVMGRGDFYDAGFRSHRDFDSFDYSLGSGGNASGTVRFLFQEGGILESRREFDRFIKPLYSVKPAEYNRIEIQGIRGFDRSYDAGSFVSVKAEADQVYGTKEVSCSVGDATFPLYDDGRGGDLLGGDGIWTNDRGFEITRTTPTGDYVVSCVALDRKGNSVSDSFSFPVFDRGRRHRLVFSAEGVRVRPSGSARVYVSVKNAGDFPEQDIFLDVEGLPENWSVILPERFDLDVNETRVVSLGLEASPAQGLGEFPLELVLGSRDAIESARRVFVDVDLFDVELDFEIRDDIVALQLTGDDGKPVSGADVSVSLGGESSSYVPDVNGRLSFRSYGADFFDLDVEGVGYRPYHVRLGLREREISYWFPISAFVIVVLTLICFRLYWRMPGRDFMEDAFVIALVVGVFITLAWVGFTMRGKEPFTALYFGEGSYSNVLEGNSTSFRYVVDCWEHEPTEYNLSFFVGSSLVDVDSFRLGQGESIQLRYLEGAKTLPVPDDLRLPARVRLVLQGANRSYDIHFFLRERLPTNDSASNVSCRPGVDCGGSCPPCEVGGVCSGDLDCLSGFCLDGGCAAPTCFDGTLNQGETGVDCWGPCIPCYCLDNVSNIDESGLDCGGPCWGCRINEPCFVDLDCQSGFCHLGLCRTPTCDDGFMNQNESGVDCGGPCMPCPSCFDGLKNQDELDVDCGGPCMPCNLVYENGTHVSWINSVDGFITSVDLSPEGSYVAVASNGMEGYVTLFDSGGVFRWTGRVLAALTDVRFLGGSRLISPYPESYVYLFDLNGVNRIFELDDASCVRGVCDMDSVCGVSRGSDVFFGFNRSQNRWVYSVLPRIGRASFSSDCSRQIVSNKLNENNSAISLLAGGKSLQSFYVRGDVYSVAVSSNGSFFAAGWGGRRMDEDNLIYFFNNEGGLLWEHKADWNIYSLSVSDDGLILAGSRSGWVYLLNASGDVVWSYDSGSSVFDVELSPGGDFGVFGNADGRIFFVSNPLVNCSDGVKNMGESDIDCGGPCMPCDVNKHCFRRMDCASNFCLEGHCQVPTCSDGFRNQGEEGIDCGGPCLPCRPACFVDVDCGRDFVSDPYCFGDFVLRDYISFSCAGGGILESSCEVLNDTRVVELCIDSRCAGGVCV